MIEFILGLFIGAVAGTLVYRKHRDKIEAAAQKLRDAASK